MVLGTVCVLLDAGEAEVDEAGSVIDHRPVHTQQSGVSERERERVKGIVQCA